MASEEEKSQKGEEVPDEEVDTISQGSALKIKQAAAREAEKEEERMKKIRNRPPSFKTVELTESQKLFKSMIGLIQRHERARVARLQTQELKEKQRIQRDIAWHVYQPIPQDVQERSVDKIQRFWRGYVAKHRAWSHMTGNRLLMGELTPSWRPHAEKDKMLAVNNHRHELQKVADEEYEAALQQLKVEVCRGADDVKDDIADHLRWYIQDWYRRIGELPDFPAAAKIDEPEGMLGWPKDTPEDFIKRMTKVTPGHREMYPGLPPHLLGGSALLVAGFWVDPDLWDLAHTAARLAKGKAGGKESQKKEKLTKQQLKEKKAEEKEKKRLENEVKKKVLEEKLKRGVVPNPTDLLDPFTRHLDKSNAQWNGFDDLESNPNQTHRDDLPRTQIVYDQHNELREVVDELMRMEIERLQSALNKDRGKKKKGGAKKKKKKKPKKKKEKKDLTHDRTEESLFRELVENGIVKKSQDIQIDSFFCDPSWNNYDLRREPWWQNSQPNLWDVKQVVKEYAILPLGSVTVHRSAPLVRSLLLAGYPDCGKRMLVDAIATETGSVLFDLSPANTAGKYPGKKGLNMLVHLVSKMSKILQPSVIFIEGGEKVFYKKVPKAEKQDNPKALQKQLPKMVKSIGPQDQVLLVATSEAPWMGKVKSMRKTFDKIVPVLAPDQSTSAHYWHLQLMRYHGVDRDFLHSPLAWCTQGYPLATIDKVIRNLMTAERVVALKYRPLDPQELLDLLLGEAAISEEQKDKLWGWYEATYPLAKKRGEKAKIDKELRDKQAAAEAKKKDQKKKK
ncbi:dynein regulatory complex protein 11-like [Macrosteles quadrilineatus]|uniref:dynein regulatory complex protein 11-like n=1 Tax=Macrosteles quadrilineatus TaxID=74068 RepID=UPI0023E2AEEE|nr:dynein regulatory complex protein 11-like [Macrosteles quadrilineatus]